MKSRLILPTFLLLSAIFWSCKKEDQPQEDRTKPTITVVSPANNTMLMNGDAIVIKVNMADNDALHDCTVQLKNLTANTVLLDIEKDVDEATFAVDTTYAANVTTNSDFLLTVTASDHAENVDTVRVHLHVMPQ